MTLTSEQKSLILEYRKKWEAIALSTERINQEKSIAAINSAYSLIGMEAPKITFCASPYAAYLQLKDTPLNSLAGDFDERIKDKLHIHLMEQVSRDVWVNLVTCLLVDRVWIALEPFYKELGVFIVEELEGQIFPSLASERLVGDACWFDFFINVLDCNYLLEEWNVFRDLTTECAYFFPFEEICIICDRPTKLSLDTQFRLHADEGAAIEFSDGYCTYAHHGELVASSDRARGGSL